MPASGRHIGFVMRLRLLFLFFFHNYRDLVKKSKPFQCTSYLLNNIFFCAITSDTVWTFASFKYFKRDIRLNI